MDFSQVECRRKSEIEGIIADVISNQAKV